MQMPECSGIKNVRGTENNMQFIDFIIYTMMTGISKGRGPSWVFVFFFFW